jgi:hypothetical protein
MYALTFTQPWATLVASGAKQIETRSWPTNHRGIIAIHAGASLTPVGGRIGLQAICADRPFRAAIEPEIYEEHETRDGERYPTWDLLRLPRGAVVAVATLTDCHCVPAVPRHFPRSVPDDHPHASYPVVLPPFADTAERAFGDYAPGRFAWLMGDVRRLAVPVFCRGYQRLWRLPEAVEAAVRAQIGAGAGELDL